MFVPNFKILSQVVSEKYLTEKKFTDTQTNILTEKAKTIYPLYTSYAWGIINHTSLKLIIQVNSYDAISLIQFWTRRPQEHSHQCLYSLQFSLQLNKAIIYEPCHEKTCLRGFQQGPTQTVQPQKMATGLKFWNLEVKGLYYVAKKKRR